MAIFVPFTGGCACGAIRYECSAAPLQMWQCHCRDCKRFTGSAFAAYVWVPTPALTFTKGEPKYYGVLGLSGNPLYRGFCPTCGSPLGWKSDVYSDIRGLSAGSLDDPSGLEPTGEAFTSRAEAWESLNPALPHFETFPSEAEIQALFERLGLSPIRV